MHSDRKMAGIASSGARVQHHRRHPAVTSVIVLPCRRCPAFPSVALLSARPANSMQDEAAPAAARDGCVPRTDTATTPSGGASRTNSTTPKSGAAPAQYQPYVRARLGAWLAPSIATAGASPLPFAGTASGGGGDGDSVLGSGPRSVLDLTCDGLEICVPHDREPGSTERYCEMYVKAVRSAFAGPPAPSRIPPKNGFTVSTAAAASTWPVPHATKPRRH